MNPRTCFRAVISSVVLASCAPGAPEHPMAVAPSAATRAQAIGAATPLRDQAIVGMYRGHYDAASGRLSFSRAMGVRDGRTPRPGFTQTLSDTVTLDDNGSSVFGAVPFGAGMCSANELCARVRVTNDSSVQIEAVRVEIYDLTGGAALNESDALGANYPSNAGSAGGWNYGAISASGGQASKDWRFATAAGASFDFSVAVWGTYLRSSYVASDVLTLAEANNEDSANAVWSNSAPAWRDACLWGTQVINGATSFTEVTQTPVFPSAIYGTSINTANGMGALRVSSAGTLGLSSVASGTNVALTDSGASNDTFYPLWDALELTNGEVCVGEDPTSSEPDRRYVVTWKNANVSGLSSSRLTFSIVLQERTDNVWFLYHRWMTGDSGCSSDGTGSDSVRGGSATVGVRGSSSAHVTEVSRDAPFLPAHSASCAGAGAYIALTATPANPS
jgi:hypothetical protein